VADLQLHTPRTLLRPLVPEDLAAVHAMWIDPHVRKFLWDDQIISEEVAAGVLAASARDFAEHGFGLWGVYTRTTNELMGFCGLRSTADGVPELLYGLLPAFWGNGLAVDAARAVLSFAFHTIGATEVSAATDTPNVASVRVMERLGMRFERRGTLNGLDTLFYRITRDEFGNASTEAMEKY
jgi:[ribosomal protein S5]-alanine N-acetyltransferase